MHISNKVTLTVTRTRRADRVEYLIAFSSLINVLIVCILCFKNSSRRVTLAIIHRGVTCCVRSGVTLARVFV